MERTTQLFCTREISTEDLEADFECDIDSAPNVGQFPSYEGPQPQDHGLVGGAIAGSIVGGIGSKMTGHSGGEGALLGAIVGGIAGHLEKKHRKKHHNFRRYEWDSDSQSETEEESEPSSQAPGSPKTPYIPDKSSQQASESQMSNKSDFLKTKVFQRDLGTCFIKGFLRGLHYGKFDGESAALIIFGFTFHHEGNISNRYQAASVKITFFKDSKQGSSFSKPGPVVRSIFPTAVFGEVSKENVRWSIETPLAISTTPFIPIVFNAKVTAKKETNVLREHRMQFRGTAYGDRSSEFDNIARWALIENKAQQNGIPHDIICGTIVSHNGEPFNASVKASVATGSKRGIVDHRAWVMSGWPWTKDDPIYFCPEHIPSNLRVKSLEKFSKDWSSLTEKECMELTPVPAEYQVTVCNIFF
jgi:hypothetical protein